MIAIYRIEAVLWRYLYLFRRSLDRLGDAIYWPILDMVLWGLTVKWLDESGADVPNIVVIMLTALVFWQIMWRAQYEVSINLLEEFWNQNLINMFGSPLRVIEWIIGVMVVGALKNILTLIVGALVALGLYSLNIFMVGWYFLPFMVILTLFGWTLGFFISGLIINYGSRIQTVAWTLPHLAAPFSSVFYPLEVLPEWAQFVVFEGMRSLVGSGTFNAEAWLTAIPLSIGYFLLSLLFFIHMFEKSRKKGLARLE
jgi:ABC-2 type transport system permease protein